MKKLILSLSMILSIFIVCEKGKSPVYSSSLIGKWSCIRFSEYNEPRVLYSPKHHTSLESNYKPELRTTLFWVPNIKVKKNEDFLLNYYIADNSQSSGLPSKVLLLMESLYQVRLNTRYINRNNFKCLSCFQ